uniref:Ras-related protein n=1 Tax=Schistosoma japonicum TaxID=6182 RepID=Q5DD00_SCHJA|nr:unknown [Schistosoma japonicum]
MQQLQLFKVALIGIGGVGKSALTLQFMYEEFVEEYEPTKADSYRKTINVDGEQIQLNILDTAGQESYGGVMESCMRSCDGFLLVYSVDDEESVTVLSELYERVIRVKNNDQVPLIVVANKCDLTGPHIQKYIDEGANFAVHYKVQHIRTSAKTCLNVDKIFTEICREIRQSQLKNGIISEANAKT